MKKILLFSSLIFWLLVAEVNVQGQTLQGEWLTGNGGDYSVFPPIIQVDNKGNIYQAGSYNGATLNLGTAMLTGGPYGSAYVARFNPDGQVVWVNNFGTDGYTYANNFHVDPDGTSRLVGSFYGNYLALNGDTLKKPASVSEGNYYLILDKDGNTQHFTFLVEPIDTSSFYVSYNDWDNLGRMAIVGINNWDGDTLAFGNLGLSVEQGESTLFVAYFDEAGTPVWATSSRTTFGEFIQLMDPMIVMDNSSNVFISASYDGLGKVPVFGTDTLWFIQQGNIFFVKFDSNGNYLWANGSEGGSYPFVTHMLADNQNNVIFSGVIMSDTLRFGPVELVNPSGADDNFIIKMGPDGTPLWGHLIATENYGTQGKKQSKGQALQGAPNNIILDGEDNIYLLTWFENDSLIFDGDTLLNVQGADNLVVKYQSNGTYSWAKGIPGWNGQTPSATIDEKDWLFVYHRLDVSFTLDSVTLFTDGMSSPCYLLGFDNNGTAVYGNTLTVSQYSDVSPYTIDSDGRAHLILTGGFTGDLQINNTTVTAGYPDNLFLARLAYLTRMSGVITDAVASPVTSGYVYLYKLLPSGQAPVEDSVMIQGDGSYMFKDFTYDDYLVYAFPDTTTYNNALGTYYGNEIAWELADTVHAIQDTLLGLDIQVTELTVLLNGTGTIEGTVEYEGSTKKSTASVTGEPVKKVKVILIGTEKSTQNVIAWVYTNDQGQYVFENIPDGNYSIIVDIPGLPMDSTYTITVTGNVVSGLDFLVSETEVLVNTASNVEIPKTGVAELKVWPNPASGPFEIFFAKGEIESVTVFNSQGKVVRQVWLDNGLHQLQMDLSDQPAGIYYLRITGNKTTGVTTLVIQH